MVIIFVSFVATVFYLLCWVGLAHLSGDPDHLTILNFEYLVPLLARIGPLYALMAFGGTIFIYLGGAILEKCSVQKSWPVLLVGLIVGGLFPIVGLQYLYKIPFVLPNLFTGMVGVEGHSWLGLGKNATVEVWIGICSFVGLVQAGMLIAMADRGR